MRWVVLLGALACAGCSTAPLAGFLDTVAPAKVRLEPVPDGPVADPFLAPPRGPTGPPTVPPVTIPPTSSNTVAPPSFAPPTGPPEVTIDPPSPWPPKGPNL